VKFPFLSIRSLSSVNVSAEKKTSSHYVDRLYFTFMELNRGDQRSYSQPMADVHPGHHQFHHQSTSDKRKPYRVAQKISHYQMNKKSYSVVLNPVNKINLSN